ncbi:MAG: hypothetical protein RI897_2456 [Verrucomicrobiota bacterium]
MIFKTCTILAAALVALPVVAQQKPALETVEQKGSYAIGADIAANFKRQGVEVDVQALTAGFADASAGNARMTDAELRAATTAFREIVMAKVAEKSKAAASENLKLGAAYLEANGKKAGVKTTASGLQYEVIKSGAGASPKAEDTVSVHYHGTLIDGTVFDSSIERGEPATFPVGGVIKGWVEALQMMKVGDKWKLTIPAELAYGERSPGGEIGPNSTLIFEVELLEIE